MASILAYSNTAGTQTGLPINSSAATLISYGLAENNFSLIEIQLSVILVTDASSTAQAVRLTFKKGSTIIDTIDKNVTAAIDDKIINVSFYEKIQSKQTLTVTIGGVTGADATHTLFTLQSYKVIGYW